MSFVLPQKIKFKHCDPAGIVFYPRYFEMINDTGEAFFEDVLSYPFGPMHPDNGVPTVQISTEFTAPSRLGEVIDIMLQVARLGRSSLDLTFEAHGPGRAGAQKRFAASSTLVHVGKEGRPAPWPAAVSAVLTTHLEGENDAT